MSELPPKIKQSRQFKNFTGAIHTDYTMETYLSTLQEFVASAKAKTAEDLFGTAEEIEDRIRIWIDKMKASGLRPTTIKMRMHPLKLFYEQNRTTVAWKIIMRNIPHAKQLKIEGWSREQMQEMLKHAEIREQAMIPLLASTGMRRGAIPPLRMRNLKPRDEYKIYQITVYDGENEEYVTYCSPEARVALERYFRFRRDHGEPLTQSSYVFRLEWNEDSPKAAKVVKPMTDKGVSSAIYQVLKDSGIRVPVTGKTRSETGRVRHGQKIVHGFRSFYETTMLDNGFDENWLSMLKGEKMRGLRQNYYKPKDDTLLVGTVSPDGRFRKPGYVDIMRELVISDEERAKIKVAELEKKIVGEEKMQKQIDGVTRGLFSLSKVLTPEQVHELYDKDPDNPIFQDRR